MTALLLIIYLAFISLGLPDSMLGTAWTVMYTDVGAPITLAGLISMVISGGTILSSLSSARVIRRFGTWRVVTVSVMLTAVALFGFAASSAVWMLILFAIPLGLGAGAVDAALNNFVAVHYKPRHMNWLHCFWGIGATGGPLVIAAFLSGGGSWRTGYVTIGIAQAVLVAGLWASGRLWNQPETAAAQEEAQGRAHVSNRNALKIRGVKASLLTFLCYCALEIGLGVWAASYLTTQRAVSPASAALWVSLYYGGITVGRFFNGLLSERFRSEWLIRGGLVIIAVGILLLLLPLPTVFCMAGLILIGLGCAPVYPSMIYLVPKRFGKAASQTVIGLSMATAYVGSTLMPPIIGAASAALSLGILPYVLAALLLGMAVASEKINRDTASIS
ncbi:MAG TPA: MFS transporter [Candidatus Limiplasma sp.]|nr:MFS transporter [Candidatus Limiplasma sp.]